ncbi:MAG: hypothetical protein ACKOWI_02215, partial [Rhodoluna sp.]
SQSPSVTSASTDPATSQGEHDDEDSLREEQLEHRYGQDRDIAAPPLLVKRSSTNPKSFVSQPIKIVHSDQAARPAGAQEPPSMLPHTFNATRNQPVIRTIVRDGFSSPAQEFLTRAYIGMGMLAAVAAVLGGVVAVRYKSRGNAMDDFDYQTPNP